MQNLYIYIFPHAVKSLKISEFSDNNAKRRISKRVFQENKARQNFRKTNISYAQIRTRLSKLICLNPYQ